MRCENCTKLERCIECVDLYFETRRVAASAAARKGYKPKTQLWKLRQYQQYICNFLGTPLPKPEIPFRKWFNETYPLAANDKT